MKSKRVSVIIPVYNVARYVRECLDSVLKQTYQNLEVIVVDDGSNDGSSEICDEFKFYDTWTIIHQPNMGLSGARNTGLKYVTGEYICIIDSDDYLRTDYVDKMVSIAEQEKVDLVVCGYSSVDENGNHIERVVTQSNVKIVDNLNAMKYLIADDVIQSFTWNKLFTHKVIDSIEFPSGRYNQDIAVMHEVIDKAKKVAIVDDDLYYYRQRAGSILASRGIKLNFDQIYAYERRLNFIRANYPEFLEDMVIIYTQFAMSVYYFYIGTEHEFDAFNKVVLCQKEIFDKKYGSRRFRVRYILTVSPCFKLLYSARRALVRPR